MNIRIALGLVALCLLTPSMKAQEAAENPIQVTLLDAGKAPLKKLRLQLEKGHSETATVSMKMSMAMNLDGQAAPPQTIPEILQTLKMKVEKVDGNTADTSFEVEAIEIVPDPNVPEGMIAAMKEGMAGIVGMSGTAKLDNRGFNLGTTINLPDGAPAEVQAQLEGLKQGLERMAAPLPAEAVGLGARWKIVQPFLMNGAEFQSTHNYKITKIEGEVITAEVTTKIVGENQQVRDPNLPEGTTMVVDSMLGEGEGKVVFHLGKITPASKAKVTMHQETTVSSGGEDQKIVMDLVMTMGMKLAD